MAGLDLSEYVRVTNRTGSTIKGRYDGKDYVFRDGDPTDVHQLAVKHIFGFGDPDKTAAFHRLGWLNDVTYEAALERLKDIDFDDVPTPPVDISPDKRRSRKQIGSPPPLAGADADGGEVGHSTSPPDAEAF